MLQLLANITYLNQNTNLSAKKHPRYKARVFKILISLPFFGFGILRLCRFAAFTLCDFATLPFAVLRLLASWLCGFAVCRFAVLLLLDGGLKIHAALRNVTRNNRYFNVVAHFIAFAT